jgi:hypothetical protein
MKTIKEILDNYKEYEVFLDDRFGVRLCQFLTIEEMGTIGFVYKDTEKAKAHEPKEWTEENILAQLKKDVEFGWEKACDERGISANLMYEVVKSWCKVLENKFADFDCYAPYGEPLFMAVAGEYGWEL